MLDYTDIVRPVEWMKSFTGDDLPPGPKDDFYTGFKFARQWSNGNLEFLFDLYREFGPVFTGRLMGLKTVWCIGAEANQYMYVDKWRDFHWWGKAYEGHLAGLIGEGLLASVDEQHDKARRLLDPVFSKDNLKKYVSEMIDLTEDEVTKLKDGQEFDFYDWVYDLALLNATNCFMGMDTDRVDTRDLHENFDICVKYYQKPIHLQTLRGPFTPYRKFKNARDKLDSVLYEEIDDRRKSGPKDKDNILDRLLDAEKDGMSFTDEEIRDQIMNLYWAGHDTTISAISWMMMLIGKYPDVYDRVKTEIDERLGDEPITAEEAIDGLPYLEMVLDETLRLYPPAWIAIRRSREEFEMYGHTIPEGIDVIFSSYVTHRLPHLYDQPEAFKPERMRPENKRTFKDGAYIPFARGPRTCIGMNFAKYEIKLIVATLFRHFDYELIPGQSFKGFPVATLTPEAVRMELDSRSNGVSMAGDSRQSTRTIPDDGGPSDESDTDNGCPVH